MNRSPNAAVFEDNVVSTVDAVRRLIASSFTNSTNHVTLHVSSVGSSVTDIIVAE